MLFFSGRHVYIYSYCFGVLLFLVRSEHWIPHGSARLTPESFCLSLEAREVGERLQGLELQRQPQLACLVAF